MADSNCVFYEKDILPASSSGKKNIKKISSLIPNAVDQSFLLSANGIIFFLDKALYVKSFSPTTLFFVQDYFTKIQNFSSKDMQGKKLDAILCPFPKFLKNALLNALKGKAWISRPFHNKNGDKLDWLQWEVFPYLDKSNEISGVIVCARDITYYQQLLLAYKKLQCANELLEGFNLILAHDLMQPLRQISNFIDIIQENHQESLKDVLCALQKSMEHVQNLSESITLYCKQGNLTAKSEKISIKQLINEICANSLVTEKFLLHCNIKDDVFIHANRTCMIQLFQNLLANAIKHSACEKGIITLSGVRKGKNFYTFFLHNNGHYSEHLMKKNIFFPFQSFSSEGSGLGLMICKKIITAYKGKIFFCSKKNEGITVCFTLPIYKVKGYLKASEKKSLVNCEYALH